MCPRNSKSGHQLIQNTQAGILSLSSGGTCRMRLFASRLFMIEPHVACRARCAVIGGQWTDGERTAKMAAKGQQKWRRKGGERAAKGQ